MKTSKLTAPQIEVLSIIGDGFHYEPGEIWQHHSSYDNTPSPLGLHNFGRTMDVLQRRRLVERDDCGYTITDAGRTALSDRDLKTRLKRIEQLETSLAHVRAIKEIG